MTVDIPGRASENPITVVDGTMTWAYANGERTTDERLEKIERNLYAIHKRIDLILEVLLNGKDGLEE